jgi:hypothetical protein
MPPFRSRLHSQAASATLTAGACHSKQSRCGYGPPEDDVRWRIKSLTCCPVGEIEPVTMPTPAEREAMLERLPKKMQDRFRHRGS